MPAEMSPEEEGIKARAIAFAKSNKKTIANRHTDRSVYPTVENPASIFMAGSPGAGKTEAAEAIISGVTREVGPIVHIDPDPLRSEFADYNGSNSWLFQGASSILVDKIHDLALKNSQNFVFDSTLSDYARAEKNIERSVNKSRDVLIMYVYRDPVKAWEFVLEREVVEGRRVLKESFIERYFSARETVNRIKSRFGDKIKVDLLIRDGDHRPEFNILKIDSHLREKYTPLDLKLLLREI